jgi:hypothetical protein
MDDAIGGEKWENQKKKCQEMGIITKSHLQLLCHLMGNMPNK